MPTQPQAILNRPQMPPQSMPNSLLPIPRPMAPPMPLPHPQQPGVMQPQLHQQQQPQQQTLTQQTLPQQQQLFQSPMAPRPVQVCTIWKPSSNPLPHVLFIVLCSIYSLPHKRLGPLQLSSPLWLGVWLAHPLLLTQLRNRQRRK